MTTDPHLVVQRDRDITRVRIAVEDLLDDESILQIGNEIMQVIEDDPSLKLIISFEGVRHLSSTVLGILIKVSNKVRNQGGQLRLSDIRPPLQEVFVITRLNKLFQIHDSADQAADSFV